jgi:outer membrane protein assembly factor BamE (lipoprotein component of BamABCDE complex)
MKKVLACVLSGFVFLTALSCILPRVIFESHYGRPPLSAQEYLDTAWKVKTGMTADEVRQAIGEPHKEIPDRNDRRRIDWFYYTDSFEYGFFGVSFGQDGRVSHTWIP